MALTIKQYGKKWRLSIDHEEWELDSREDLENAVKTLLDLKEKKGQLFQKASEDENHDSNCEGAMCWCKARRKNNGKQ